MREQKVGPKSGPSDADVVEAGGYIVTDYDAEDRLITMEKTINPEGARLVRYTEVAFWPATPKDESLPEGHC